MSIKKIYDFYTNKKGGKFMNKKQKVVATTLSTITALSSVTALTNIPNRAMLSVQALENTNETTKQTKH